MKDFPHMVAVLIVTVTVLLVTALAVGSAVAG